MENNEIITEVQQKQLITRKDLYWLMFILIMALILVSSIRLSDNKNIVDIFSFMANGISITLAIVAIIYAFYQSLQSQVQNRETTQMLNNIDNRINNILDSMEKQLKANEDINNDISALSASINELSSDKPVKNDNLIQIKSTLEDIKAKQKIYINKQKISSNDINKYLRNKNRRALVTVPIVANAEVLKKLK